MVFSERSFEKIVDLDFQGSYLNCLEFPAVAVNFHQLETPKTSNPVAYKKKVLSYVFQVVVFLLENSKFFGPAFSFFNQTVNLRWESFRIPTTKPPKKHEPTKQIFHQLQKHI